MSKKEKGVDRMAAIGKPVNRAFITDKQSFVEMLKNFDKETSEKRKKMAEEFSKNNVDNKDQATR